MITGFLEGFVDNEINLNKEFTCKNTCDDYKITRQYGCHNDTPCGLKVKNQRIRKCKGILRDCEYIGSDLEICPSVCISSLWCAEKWFMEQHENEHRNAIILLDFFL